MAAVAGAARLLDRCPGAATRRDVPGGVERSRARPSWSSSRCRSRRATPARRADLSGVESVRPARSPRPAVRSASYVDPTRRGDRDRRDLPPPRRHSAGDRAGGGAAPPARPGRAGQDARPRASTCCGRACAMRRSISERCERRSTGPTGCSNRTTSGSCAPLSVFAGGFTFDAVADVTGIDRFDVLDQLERLVAHHLVRVGAEDPTASGSICSSRSASSAPPSSRRPGRMPPSATRTRRGRRLRGDGGGAADRRRTRRRGDAAQPRARQHPRRAGVVVDGREDDAGLRVATDLWRYWWMRGAMSEGRRWLDQMIASYRGPDTATLGVGTPGQRGPRRGTGRLGHRRRAARPRGRDPGVVG